MLFDLPTGVLALVIAVVIFGATALGVFVGHRSRHLAENLSEPMGVLQGALLGVVGLILAFGLSLALSRYDDRRASLVNEANAIGTTYLRAQMLEPEVRFRSMRLLTDYTASAIDVAGRIPGSDEEENAVAEEGAIQEELWTLARRAVADEPVATPPRLYIETLNEMIDAQATRQAALNNRVPQAVLLLELIGAAIAVALLSGYLVLIGRGAGAVVLISALVAFLLFVTADLDRPTRGLIKVPDTALVNEYESMTGAPRAGEG